MRASGKLLSAICTILPGTVLELNIGTSDKHSLCNSIRSFLAVKRQEVTGLVK